MDKRQAELRRKLACKRALARAARANDQHAAHGHASAA
jgi:hypothetical protein